MNSLRLLASRVPANVQLGSVLRGASGRAAISRQYSHISSNSFKSSSSTPAISAHSTFLRSRFLPEEIRTGVTPATSRSFHNGSTLRQKEKPASESTKEKSEEGESAKKAAGEGEEGSKEEGKEKSETEGEGEGEGEKDGKKKEAPPPPPPHGDKSPWQVFTETLQTEFKASKEWNESTKALADGAQQFTENESVRKARQAYESTTGAVSSTAGTVLKSTAGAVGKGAAWTWETPVVKGVRVGVNATASVIEKGTRPIRETEAFKNVKNVIDDGSSSRYGGWVEKEERRKIRELREQAEAQKAGIPGGRVEVAKENPE